MVNPVTLAPQSPEGFYAINNPFLVNGPKGFIEFTPLENEDMYIRFDIPGVPNNDVKVILDQSNKAVCIFGDAPKEHKYDASVRSYDGTTLRKKISIGGINSKIVCKCCDFYSDYTSHVADGVLRLVLTKIHTDHTITPRPPCISFIGGPDGEGIFVDVCDICGADPNLTGPILMPHPCVGQGSQMPYESKVLQNGGLYVRVDMPGVPKENFTVSVMNGRVKVTGEAPARGHDSAGRFYSGDVAVLSTPVDLPVRKIKTIAKNGVIRLIIPPPLNLSAVTLLSSFLSSCGLMQMQIVLKSTTLAYRHRETSITRLAVSVIGYTDYPIGYTTTQLGSCSYLNICVNVLLVYIYQLHYAKTKDLCFVVNYIGQYYTTTTPVSVGTWKDSLTLYESKQLPNGGLFLRLMDTSTPSVMSCLHLTTPSRCLASHKDLKNPKCQKPRERTNPKVAASQKSHRKKNITLSVESWSSLSELFLHLAGFYAINNQFLASGPKGFMEFKMLENEDMFVRIDFPGVPKDGVRVFLDQSKKAVCIFADAPKEHKYDYSERNYGTTTGLVCKCCEVSGFTSLMCDGVLRLILTKSNITPQRSSCISFLAGPDFREDLRGDGPHKFPHGTDPNADPKLTGRILIPHPCVNYGSEMAYESKQLQTGGLYVRVDMPGVPKENFTVAVMNGRVKVTGEAPAVSHDSSGRFYSGDVAMLSTPFDIPIRKIKIIAKNGVIRLIIPPV
ncbi:unnamed protein product [Arabidopsis halleri]